MGFERVRREEHPGSRSEVAQGLPKVIEAALGADARLRG